MDFSAKSDKMALRFALASAAIWRSVSRKKNWLVCVSAQVIAEGVILSLNPKKDSNHLLYLLSPLQPKSSCPLPPISFSSSTLKSVIFWTLFTVFPLAISYLSFSTRCPLLAHCIFYSHISPSSFSFFGFFHLTLFHSHVHLLPLLSLPHSLPQSDCWFEAWER